MSPLICPRPRNEDCFLYDRRLVFREDEPLRKAILGEQHQQRPDLADLIRAEVFRGGQQQTPPLLLPAPLPVQPFSTEHRVSEEVHHE